MGRPDKTVVNIGGDGCFRMNMNEIATAVRCNKPLIANCGKQPCAGYGASVADTCSMNTDIHIPSLNDAVDFVKLSEGYGSEGNPGHEDRKR